MPKKIIVEITYKAKPQFEEEYLKELKDNLNNSTMFGDCESKFIEIDKEIILKIDKLLDLIEKKGGHGNHYHGQYLLGFKAGLDKIKDFIIKKK